VNVNDGPGVLLVVTSEDDGGAVRSTMLLARNLPAAGVRATVVVHRETRLTRDLAAAGIPCRVVPELIENLSRNPRARSSAGAIVANLRGLPRAVRRLRELAREQGASLLYGQGTWANYLVALAAGDGTAGLEAVWHVRNNHAPPVTRAIVRTLARTRAVRAVIAVSASAARPYGGLDLRLEVVHNGVDRAVCDAAMARPALRALLGLGREVVLAGFAGRLVPHKGLDTLLRAVRAVAEKQPGLHLAVIGGTPLHARRDVLGELRERVRSWGLGSRIHLPGYLPGVEPMIADLDLLVVPSTFPDPCPRVVVEGLSLGVPVVASRIGGIPELVRDGVDGVLLPPGDEVALARALEDLAGDAPRRAAMAQAALARARTTFDAARVAARVAAIIREPRAART
jgi:glycosyltransferase involved in cell wall biosynthesis